MIAMFIVYYNLLFTYVSRREELVLKRLRTGECSDLEILVGIALPALLLGVGLLLVMTVGAVVGMGQPLPVNPMLLLLATAGGWLLFTELALVTTTFTRNTEAAQITSLPIVLLCMFGAGFTPLTFLPEWVVTGLRWTPLAPVYELTQLGWAGLTRDGTSVDFAGSLTRAWLPTLILLGWIALAGWSARAYFRWESRH